MTRALIEMHKRTPLTVTALQQAQAKCRHLRDMMQDRTRQYASDMADLQDEYEKAVADVARLKQSATPPQ